MCFVLFLGAVHSMLCVQAHRLHMKMFAINKNTNMNLIVLQAERL